MNAPAPDRNQIRDRFASGWEKAKIHSGEIATINQAAVLAGIRKPSPSRAKPLLSKLRALWAKATPAEKDEFIRDILGKHTMTAVTA